MTAERARSILNANAPSGVTYTLDEAAAALRVVDTLVSAALTVTPAKERTPARHTRPARRHPAPHASRDPVHPRLND